MATLQLSKEKTKLVPMTTRTVPFSSLAKRQGVRLWAKRPTTIQRNYRGRVVERKLDTDEQLEGDFSTPIGEGESTHAWVYVIQGRAKRKPLPMDYYLVKIEDFQWQAYIDVNLKK